MGMCVPPRLPHTLMQATTTLMIIRSCWSTIVYWTLLITSTGDSDVEYIVGSDFQVFIDARYDGYYNWSKFYVLLMSALKGTSIELLKCASWPRRGQGRTGRSVVQLKMVFTRWGKPIIHYGLCMSVSWWVTKGYFYQRPWVTEWNFALQSM